MLNGPLENPELEFRVRIKEAERAVYHATVRGRGNHTHLPVIDGWVASMFELLGPFACYQTPESPEVRNDPSVHLLHLGIRQDVSTSGARWKVRQLIGLEGVHAAAAIADSLYRMWWGTLADLQAVIEEAQADAREHGSAYLIDAERAEDPTQRERAVTLAEQLQDATLTSLEREAIRASLLRTHEPMVVAVALEVQKRRNEMELEDLMAAAREGMVQAIDRFDPTRGVFIGKWLGDQARYFAQMAVRQDVRVHREMQSEYNADTDQTAGQLPNPGEAWPAARQGGEERVMFDQAMGSLPEADQKLVLMVTEEGLTTEQAGERLGMTSGAVQRRFHRIYSKLNEDN